MSTHPFIQCFTCRPLWRWLSFLVLASLSLVWPVEAEDAGRDDKQDAAEPTVARGARELEAAMSRARARMDDGPNDVAAAFEAEMALWTRFRDRADASKIPIKKSVFTYFAVVRMCFLYS